MKAQFKAQELPHGGPLRAALRDKGQFWTPDWVAEAMVAYSLAGGSRSLFDPAVGAGAFFRAARRLERETGARVKLYGAEIDPQALRQGEEAGLARADLANVAVGDFVLSPPRRRFRAIVGNPPYIRHHRLPGSVKAQLRAFAAELTATSIDGRAGLHVYFLLRALQLLDRGGRLAFIMPADTCEGVFAEKLWKWIVAHYRLEAVITFAPAASPFPNIDTNPVIFLIRRAAVEGNSGNLAQARFLWARCKVAGTRALKEWIVSGMAERRSDVLEAHARTIEEGLASGLSRPMAEVEAGGAVLGDFAIVRRGIATGANEFFFLTRRQAAALRLSSDLLLPAIGRTRDVAGEEIDEQLLKRLDEAGRPTLLFAPDARPIEQFDATVRAYLALGEEAMLNNRPLIAQRRPWYKMERRSAPQFLFAYLGRRSARFIRNRAGVVPLTGFLCIYPKTDEQAFVERLWQLLRHPDTVANLARVGKSYGAGAIKVEPRALERLPLSKRAMKEVSL